MAFRVKVPGQEALEFQSQLKARRELEKSPAAALPETPGPAAMGCPGLRLQVAEIDQQPKLLVYRLSAGGRPLPAFAPGQSVSLLLDHGRSRVNRPFSLCGTVEQARRGSYYIALPRRDAALAEMLQDCHNAGTPVTVSSPWGDFAYQSARDGRRVLALAEGEGILSFISLARSLAETDSDLKLTLFCCAGREEELLFREELDALAEKCPRLQPVRMLTAERAAGCLPGPLNPNQLDGLLLDTPSSILVSGSRAFCLHLEGLLERLPEDKLLPPLQRQTLPPPPQPWLLPDYPADCRDRIFRLTLRQWDQVRIAEARAWETVLTALERAGAAAPARCRGGECGFCRARLLKGRVYLPPDCGEPRQADSALGFIHPCCSYPLSDLEVEINGDPALAGNLPEQS